MQQWMRAQLTTGNDAISRDSTWRMLMFDRECHSPRGWHLSMPEDTPPIHADKAVIHVYPWDRAPLAARFFPDLGM